MSISWNRFSQEFGITLFNNSFPRIPHEITQKGPEVIINYFKELANEEQTVYEAKLLIVGEAGTGKTTLSRKVRNCEADMPKEAEESTRGIDIVTHIWEQEDQPNFIMKIWDFGGQDVYHGIHQIFLSKRSLYVLVLDGRIEENPHYWLQAQELFGGDSPLLVLLNQKGTIRQNVAVRELQTDYNNLREYLSINLKEDTEDVRRLGSTVEHYIRNLPHLQKGEKLPAKWVRIRKKVEELSKEENFIYLRDFQKICKEEEIAEKERQLFLSDYLHDLGVLLHFSKEPQLRDILFLNNQWTTDAIYKVLDQTKAQEPPGYFTRKDLETIWSDESYEHVFEKLLALMERFDLCYQVPGQDVFIVPQLLPSDKPEGYQWEKENDLELRYRYDFLPKGIVPRLIVRLHALLQNQAQVWKRGAVFQKGEAIAEVIENFRDEYIHIRVKGHNRRRLLTIIAHQMDEINKTFQFSEKMGVNQLIPCNYSNCQCGKAFYFQLDRLLAAEKANVPELQCQNSFKMVSVQELIQGTFTKGTGLWDYQNPPYISEFEYIDELLKEGYIKEALTQLKDVVKLTPLNRSVDQLIGQYALLQQEISKGIITEEARIVASNKMLESTLNIFTDVKEGNYDVDRLQYAVVKPPLPDPIHHIRIQPIHITVHGNYVQGDAQNVASSQSGDASIDQSQTQTDQSIHLHIDKLQALLQAGQELGEFSADDAEEITYILDDLKEEKEPESPREKKRWKKFLGRIRDFAGKRIEKGADTMVSEGVKEWLKEGGMEILNGFIQTL
ncbi:MAG: COR domain-containing protein [Bacteroidota bacterium]